MDISEKRSYQQLLEKTMEYAHVLHVMWNSGQFLLLSKDNSIAAINVA